ncbi:MAG: hypothetical protein EON58_19705 [Alphaproteobacteria bacterium]|nr:MAG: hypothetical protein EON58_19705 [Alphaproteobacteria bacterium]
MNELVEVTDDPIPQLVIDYCKSHSSNDREYEKEVTAYQRFVERYRGERDRNKRLVMLNALQFLLFSDRHDMKPSYALTEDLDCTLREERDAKRAMYPLPVHQGVADILTSSTYTKGRGRTTAWQMHTSSTSSEFTGKGRDWFDAWNAQEILNSYVKFGSHRFSVGATTQRILGLLEDRYGLDFKQLEKQLKTRKPKT